MPLESYSFLCPQLQMIAQTDLQLSWLANLTHPATL